MSAFRVLLGADGGVSLVGTVIGALGAITAPKLLYGAASFVFLYARPSGLGRYLHETDGRTAMTD